jgi:hypothetical protein
LLSVLTLPQESAEPFSATFTVTQNGSTFQTDQSVSGGNYLAALDGTPLTATYAVTLNQSSAGSIVGPYNNASVTTDGTIYGAAVPNAGAITWLLTNLGPRAITQDQQSALQAAIWRTEFGNGFQFDGVDNARSGSFFNSQIAPLYQADLAALGSNTAPVSSVKWISSGTNFGQQGPGLVAVAPTVTPTPTPAPLPTPSSDLALPHTSGPSFEASYVGVQPDGSAFVSTGTLSGGNFLGTLNNVPLTASYCLNLNLGLDVPVSFRHASATANCTVYGALVPNAGAISWLLTNLGPGATTPVQQEALQAAIWHEEYTTGFEFNGQYDFQLDGADNSLGNGNDPALIQAYQADLAALGNNTAPVSNVYWISPDGTIGLGQAQSQALVALPAFPMPVPTPIATPPATSTLVLPNTTAQEFSVTYNQQSGQDVSGGNFLGTLNGTALTATYCTNFILSIATPDTFPGASVASDGTIYGIAVPNAGAISWLIANLGPVATTPVQQGALQAAIWRVEYGNAFQLDGVDNGNTPDVPFNAMIASDYRADLAALGNHTAPVSSVLWISPGDSAHTGLKHVQGLVATTSSTPGSPGPTPTQTPTATPPQVVDIVVSAQSKKGKSALTVRFNEPLNAGSASSSSVYHVFAGVKKVVKRHKQTVFTRPLAIKPVSVNGSTVTITLAKPFKGTVQATVQGTIAAANGASNNVSFSKNL